MGATNSTLEDDKPLLLCQERKRFVREALDRRCLLAVAHFAYIQSLRNTGTALRKFVEPEAPTESSLYTSTSATPDPLALIEKSQFSNISPSISQHLDTSDSFSPTPSPLSSGRFHVNHMKASRSFSTTIEEKPPVPLTATINTSSATPRRRESELDENSSLGTPPPPGNLPWDYFSLFHPVDNQFSFQEDREFTHNLDNVDDIRRLREEEGIPELEDEGEKSSLHEKDDFSDSEDDFDQPSTEPLVRMFKNRNINLDRNMTNGSHDIPSIENFSEENERQNEEKSVVGNGMYEADRTPVMTPSKVVPPTISLPINGKLREAGPAMKQGMDFFLCMKEIEGLFIKASDSGREVPRMLEADKIQLRPLFPEEIAHRSGTSFLTSCFACCTEQAPHPQASAPTEIKPLTWHRSMSSHSSSSRNPIGMTSKDGMEDLTGNLYSTICMNSGSHASTLDRLYAWERKLYDEVKASVAIRKEYDAKCRLLRDQESRADSPVRIDKTRAAVKDLHSRIRVAIHRINSISKIIEELRDNELQPQLEELIGSLTRMWAVMHDCHKHQYNIISVAYNNGSTKVSLRSESLFQAVTSLEFELNDLCSNLIKWISSHKSYLKSINDWLLKCVFPLTRLKSKRRNVQFSPRTYIAPPIFVTCRDWSILLDELPTKEVTDAMKELATVVNHFLPRQEKDRGNSNFSMSFYRKGGQTDNSEGDMHKNESPINWSHNYSSLRSSLTGFLDQLMKFSAASLEKYETLRKSINSARMAYENGGYRA